MVSIITISNDISSLKILAENIALQSYKNFDSWIIIKKHDSELENNDKIKYIQYTDKLDFFNYTNSEYIIFMEEDTYYFPNYISSCLNMLKTSHNNIAIKSYYVHNYINNRIYKCDDVNVILCGMGKNNSDKLNYLDSAYGFIKNIHNDNITEYNTILTLAANNMINIMEKEFNNFILNESIYNLYNLKYNDNNEVLYDIVYIAGGTSIIWDPTSQSLGGSEQAIVRLTSELSSDKKIAVYGNFKNDERYNNVDFIKWTKFPFNKRIKNLIAWRRHGLTMLMNNDFITDNLILDFHDNFSYTLVDLNSQSLENIFNKVNTFNFKSIYHKVSFIEFLKFKNINQDYNDKYNIIPNGIRVNSFSINNNYVRNPYRFCYCSSYDRGLDIIISKLWTKIYESQPLAELHVYYGMDYLFDENYKLNLKLLLSQHGVMDHGRQPMEMIVREKYLSTFHIYLNKCVAEIDCISIKESLITGCIPIISNFGVFKERHGLQYDWEPNNNELCDLVAKDIITKMNDFNLINNIRNMLMKSSTIIDWEDVSKLWLNKIL